MEIERVKIKRFFIWKFTLTSFALGIFIGLILTATLILASSQGWGQIDLLGNGKPVDLLKSSFVTLFSIVILIFFPILFAFLGFLYASFYNTLSRIGINLDLGMAPVEQAQPVQQQTQQAAQTIQPAPVANSQQPTNTPSQFY